LDFFEIDPPRDKRRDARWDDREKMIAVSLTTQEKGDEGGRRKQRKKKAHLRWSTGVNVNVPIVTSARMSDVLHGSVTCQNGRIERPNEKGA
jgi:hypothetical protein